MDAPLISCRPPSGQPAFSIRRPDWEDETGNATGNRLAHDVASDDRTPISDGPSARLMIGRGTSLSDHSHARRLWLEAGLER